MTKTKLLLIALACLLALPTANALAGKFEQSQHKYPAELVEESTSPQLFTFETLTVSCPKVLYTGTLSGATEKVNVIPKYGECTATLGEIKSSVTVKLTSCEYSFAIGGLSGTLKEGTESAGREVKSFAGKVALVNAGGTCAVNVTSASGCKAALAAQTPGGKTVEESEHKWFPFQWKTKKEAAATSLVYVISGVCGGLKTGTHENGTLKATMQSGENFEIN